MTWKAELANTEQLGRLIKLCANAIELAQSNKRDPQHVHEAIRALQKLKDTTSHICSCGYPHYERIVRNGSQSYYNYAIKQLCQLRAGISINVRYHSDNLYTAVVASAPYFNLKKHCWVVELLYPETMSRNVESRVVRGEFGLVIDSPYGIISCENWFSFVYEKIELHTCNHQ